MFQYPNGSHAFTLDSLGRWWGWGDGREGLPRDDKYVNMVIVLWYVHLSKLTKLYILNRCNLLLVNFISTKLFFKRINWRAWDFAFLMLFEKHCSVPTLAKPISFPFLHDFQIFFVRIPFEGLLGTCWPYLINCSLSLLIAAWLLSSTTLTKLLLQGSQMIMIISVYIVLICQFCSKYFTCRLTHKSSELANEIDMITFFTLNWENERTGWFYQWTRLHS